MTCSHRDRPSLALLRQATPTFDDVGCPWCTAACPHQTQQLPNEPDWGICTLTRQSTGPEVICRPVIANLLDELQARRERHILQARRAIVAMSTADRDRVMRVLAMSPEERDQVLSLGDVDTIDSYRTGEVALAELPTEELADVKSMMITKATEFCRTLPTSQPPAFEETT